jgi:hypothetical protein
MDDRTVTSSDVRWLNDSRTMILNLNEYETRHGKSLGWESKGGEIGLRVVSTKSNISHFFVYDGTFFQGMAQCHCKSLGIDLFVHIEED